MIIRVRLFAVLRERAGARELVLELDRGARVSDALQKLLWLTDGVPVVMAVNRGYADDESLLEPGDELALVPPVSGGSTSAVARHDRPCRA